MTTSNLYLIIYGKQYPGILGYTGASSSRGAWSLIVKRLGPVCKSQTREGIIKELKAEGARCVKVKVPYRVFSGI